MIDQVGVLLMGAPLNGTMKRTVQNFIVQKINPNSYIEQVKAAVHLIGTSAQTAAQR
jgi:hypothetical protein